MTTRNLIALLNFSALGNKYANKLFNSWRKLVFFRFIFGANKADNIHNAAVCTVWHSKRGIANILCAVTKDCSNKALFWSWSRLTFRSNLTYQNIARANFGTNADNTVFVQIGKCFFGLVRNFASNFLGMFCRNVTRVNFVTRDINRG